MEEKYNPMKSAEIATEHNYNMLDGVLNNQGRGGRPQPGGLCAENGPQRLCAPC